MYINKHMLVLHLDIFTRIVGEDYYSDVTKYQLN